MLKLNRKKDGEKYTGEEVATLPLEDVKKMVEEQVPGAFTKKTAAKKTATKKPGAKKAAGKSAKKK